MRSRPARSFVPVSQYQSCGEVRLSLINIIRPTLSIDIPHVLLYSSRHANLPAPWCGLVQSFDTHILAQNFGSMYTRFRSHLRRLNNGSGGLVHRYGLGFCTCCRLINLKRRLIPIWARARKYSTPIEFDMEGSHLADPHTFEANS